MIKVLAFIGGALWTLCLVGGLLAVMAAAFFAGADYGGTVFGIACLIVATKLYVITLCVIFGKEVPDMEISDAARHHHGPPHEWWRHH